MALKKTKRHQPRSRGTLIPRGEGKFLARIYIGVDQTGKRKYSSKMVKGSRREAEKALTKMLREVDTDTFVPPSKKNTEGFLKEWVESRSDVAKSTLRSYEMTLRNHVYPQIGQLKLEQIALTDIQRIINSIIKKGLSPRLARYSHMILKQALDRAVFVGLLARNPANGVILPRETRKEMATLTPEEVLRLLEGTEGTKFHTLWFVLLTSGMRPGEALALKWADIDGPVIRVRRTMSRNEREGTVAERWMVKEPKTAKGTRPITVPQETLKALEEHRIRQLTKRSSGSLENPEGWVFPGKLGMPITPDDARTAWNRTIRNLGLPKVRLYDARHTHMTHLLMAGVHPKVASARAGHANVGITLDTYSHVIPEMDSGAADLAADLIWKKS